jgi:putative NADH-flavin reductase
MNIAVIAAGGRTGKLVVAEALARGHHVRAGVYHDNPLTPHENLTVIECDARRDADVRQLLTGCDAVVSAIGHVKASPPDVQTAAIQHIIAAMHDCAVQRLVSLTGTGVRFAGDHITLIDRILNLAVRIIDPARVNDGIAHAKLIQQSNVDWTIIRVLKLQDVRPSAFTLREHGPTKPFVARADVAKAIIDVLEDDSFMHAAPILGP